MGAPHASLTLGCAWLLSLSGVAAAQTGAADIGPIQPVFPAVAQTRDLISADGSPRVGYSAAQLRLYDTPQPVVRVPLPSQRALRPAPSACATSELIPDRYVVAGDAYGIDPLLLRAIVQVESAADPNRVSVKGAIGLMQVMPATAADVGVPSTVLRSPTVNVATGAAHLRRLQRDLGDNLPIVLAAYNAGEGAVQRHGGIPPYLETQSYVRRVLDTYGRIQRRASACG